MNVKLIFHHISLIISADFPVESVNPFFPFLIFIRVNPPIQRRPRIHLSPTLFISNYSLFIPKVPLGDRNYLL